MMYSAIPFLKSTPQKTYIIFRVDNDGSTPLRSVERGSSVVECRTRNQVSPGSNPALLPCRRLGIFVLSIDAPVDSAV